jgi:uncharacterized Zn finger protein/superfamily II DNA or RNA helicase
MKHYGKTWWGQRWLQAFTDIDEANRLPRGRTYANTGRAYDVKLQGNQVTAKVDGSRSAPYKVKIVFQVWDRKTQLKIKAMMIESPLILSQLLNKQLPTKMMELLDRANINLFPARWKDLNARCNCPDWAQPCKHMASVVYLICKQIDQNPFILFDIHGCDLLGLLSDFRDGGVDQLQQMPTITDMLKQVQPTQVISDYSQLSEIDLGGIPDLSRSIMRVLADNPAFFEKNFTDIFKAAYQYWQKKPLGGVKFWLWMKPPLKNKRTQSEEEVFLASWLYPDRFDQFNCKMGKDYALQEICDGATHVFRSKTDLIGNLVVFLSSCPAACLHKLCPKIQLMHMIYQYAHRLLQQSAIVPQIMQGEGYLTVLRWLPALFDPEVKSIYDRLCQVCPADLVTFNGYTISPQEQVNACITWILSGLMDENWPTVIAKNTKSDVLKLFFHDGKVVFEPSDRQIPSAIYQWLAPLFLAHKSHKLHLQIEEKEGGFSLFPKILLDSASQPITIKQVMQLEQIELKLSILSDLSLIAEHLPNLDEMVRSSKPVYFDLEAFSPLLLNMVPVLQAIGVIVVLPKSLHHLIRPQMSLRLTANPHLKNDQQSFVSLSRLLDFDWQIALGDHQLSIDEFKKMLKQAGRLVKLADQYVLLDEKEVALLLKQLEKQPKQFNQMELMQALFAESIAGVSVALDKKLQSLVQFIQRCQPLPIPHNLVAQLRPYQVQGYQWLMQNIQCSFGSILADDMGLGKTLQVITVILHLKNAGQLPSKASVLVVAPTSLLSNWQRELMRFAPDLRVCLYHGSARQIVQDCDVVITSYGLVRSCQKFWQQKSWFLMIIDEAQAIKNPYTEQTKSIKAIQANHKIAMSGTPVENRLLEYWSLFDFTNQAYLGTLKQFKAQYAAPIEQDRDKDSLHRFKKLTAPFMLRRLKSDQTIIADLPKKIESNRYCTLTAEQAALYQQVVDASLVKIDQSDGMERRAMVLQMMNALKQICNHPSQFSKQPNQATFDQSGKMQMLQEIITDIHDLGEKCLIFTQYIDMGRILAKLLQLSFHVQVPFLNGSITRKARDQMVQDFQDPSSNARIFIISLKAGGTGLNLTAANHVIHYDLWWNPAVENQATDRAYRIGQSRQVLVHRFITTGTFEERIDDMIKSKKALADLTVNDGEAWITEMSTNQIRDMVNLTTTLREPQ